MRTISPSTIIITTTDTTGSGAG
ncbi:thr operon leader peptide [Sodalis ligni]|nr:thr operon leader peptide [Sodalis ligni]